MNVDGYEQHSPRAGFLVGHVLQDGGEFRRQRGSAVLGAWCCGLCALCRPTVGHRWRHR